MKKLVTLMATGVIVFGLAACGKEGPAEKAGKQIDQAVASIKSKAQDITKHGGDLDQAKAKLQKALQDTQNKIRDLTTPKPKPGATGTDATTATTATPAAPATPSGQ